jgi:hypothetical protein
MVRKGIPGIALWRYDDWQENVLDAWVFRLTVRSPDTFKKTGGFQQEIDPITGRKRVGTPRFVVNGHYVNLKEGKFVQLGNLPSTKASIDATQELLRSRLEDDLAASENRVYRDILIFINSGFEPIKQGIHLAASLTEKFKRKGVYPLFVYWHYALISQIETLIAAAIPEITKRAGSNPVRVQTLIERYLRDYRCFLGERFTKNVVRTGGSKTMRADELRELDLYQALLPLFELAATRKGVGVHLVAHSDGAFLLDMMLHGLCRVMGKTVQDGRECLAKACRSIALIAPLGRRQDMAAIESIARVTRKNEKRLQIGLVTLSQQDEGCDRTGEYQRTYPYLTQQVFFPNESGEKNRQVVSGLYENAQRLNRSPYYDHIVCPSSGLEDTRRHFGMIRNSELQDQLLERMLA